MQQLQRILRSIAATALLSVVSATASAADLSGVVRDQAGQVVSETNVQLLTSESSAIQPVPLDETTTDDAGRFRVTVPQRWFDSPQTYRQELTLLAGSSDIGMGGIVVSRMLPLPSQTLEITLEEWLPREIELVDADGNPLRDVEVKLSGLMLPMVMPQNYTQTEGQRQIAPLSMSNISPAARTNENGVVELILPSIETVGSLVADLGDDVAVTWSVINNTSVAADWSNRLQAPAFIRIPLQVAAESAEALRDLSLTVGTTSRLGSDPRTSIGQTVALDDKGEATLTTLSESILYFHSQAPEFPDWRLDKQFLENTSAVGEEGIAINFREGIIAGGRVIDAEGSPMPNVKLLVLGGISGEPTQADEDGEFEVLAAPGQQMVVMVSDADYRGPQPGPESLFMIPADAESFAIPDVVVTRLQTVTGTVQDTNSQPVSGASVLVLWDEPHPSSPQARISRQETVQTDAEGQFRFPGVDPEAGVRIAAWTGVATTDAIRQIPPADLTNAIDLVISSKSTHAAHGRAIDQAGAGIPGLPVVIRYRIDPPLVDPNLPVGADVIEVVTDDEGRFRTEQTLKPWGEYIAVVRAGSQQEAISGWRPAATGADLQLPAIVTSSITEFRGVVVTAVGDPVPEANVRLLTGSGQSEATTGNDGSFSIDAVGGHGPLLIASAEGFSFGGIELREPSQEISIVLPRPGEAPRASGGSAERVPPGLSLEERRSLAVNLFESLPKSDQQTRGRALAAVARIDAGYARKRLEKFPANGPAAMNVRRTLGMAIAGEHPAEALEVVEGFPQEGMKLYYLLQLEPRLDIDDHERRELLARILQDGRGVASADHRVMSMGLVGERLLDLGERESGEALLREGHELAGNMAPAAFSGYIRGAFAEELAQVDADAALELIEPLTDADEYNRHLTNIAHELAAIEPERAAEALDLMREMQTNYIVKSRDGAVIRVCYRMVRVDPDRAVGLVDSIEDEVNRIRCLGVMADSLLTQDEVTDDARTLAGELTETAWGILSTHPGFDDQSEVGWLFPSTMAALLLPATAELFPEQLASRIWQTMALRRPMVPSGSYVNSGAICCSEMALLLADIDPVQSRRVSAWLPDENSGKSLFEYFIQFSRTAPELIAATAPEKIEPYLAALDDETTRNRVTLAFIAALSRSGESRQRAIHGDLGLWFPDDEDLGPQD